MSSLSVRRLRRSGVLVEEKVAVRMVLQDRGGALRADFTFDRIADYCRFSLFGNCADNRFALHNLLDRHRNGLLGNIFGSGKPSLTELLFPAIFIQIDDEVWRLGFEIGRRIVEGQMSV